MMNYQYDKPGYAGFWIRALSRIIDNLLFSVFVFVLFLLFFGLDSRETITSSIFSTLVLVFILSSMLFISYFAAVLYASIALFSFSMAQGALPFLFPGEAKMTIAKLLLFVIISMTTYILYHVMFNMRGATPGKLATGLKITTEENNENLTFGKALGRFFALEFISGIAMGLGFLWAGWDPKNQTWHDKLARTLVWYKDKISVGVSPYDIVDERKPITPPPSKPKGPAFGEIVFIQGRKTNEHFELCGNKLKFGRGESCDIFIDDPDRKVSREQFEIFKRESRFFIRNLSEKRSTYLNSSRLDTDLALRENDIISIPNSKMKIKFFN